MEHYTLEQMGLLIKEEPESKFIKPVVVQNCMNPKEYKLYPVEVSVFREEQKVEIHALGFDGTYFYDKTEMKAVPYFAKKPEPKRCTGQCDVCGKCAR